MKFLPKEFFGRGEVKGYKFTQIQVTNKGFLYEVTSDDTLPHYEVFNRKINEWYNCESYPTSKSFGKWAWTFSNKEKAIEKLNSL